MADKVVLKVVICGSGSGAHTLAGIASANSDLSVTVLDVYKDKPERWAQGLKANGFTVNLPNGENIEQHPGNVKFSVTRDVQGTVTLANVVIIVSPAYAHESYLELIAEHLPDDALIVGMPGYPGFEYQCLYVLRKYGKKCSVMSFTTLPWACRINRYGESVTVLGIKSEIIIYLIDQGQTVYDPVSTVQKILGERPVLKQARNVLESIMMPKINLNPAIVYAKWKDWDGEEEFDEPPISYQGVDQFAVECLKSTSDELIDVAEKLKLTYPQLKELNLVTMHQWFINHYGDQIEDQSTLLTVMQTNKAFNGLVHKMTKTNSGKYVPDFNSRFIRENIPYGLVIQRAVAEMAGVKTPVIDEIITWAQMILGEQYLVNGKVNVALPPKTRIPQMYGLHSIDDLLKFCGN